MQTRSNSRKTAGKTAGNIGSINHLQKLAYISHIR